jgi:hypothetical protein
MLEYMDISRYLSGIEEIIVGGEPGDAAGLCDLRRVLDLRRHLCTRWPANALRSVTEPLKPFAHLGDAEFSPKKIHIEISGALAE